MELSGKSKLKFNIEEIEGMEKKVQETITELIELKVELLQSIEDLKNDWNTPAGKKFMNEVDTDWTGQVDKYIKNLDAVEELLRIAAFEYESVKTDANKLSF